jgi:hypothetical protein
MPNPPHPPALRARRPSLATAAAVTAALMGPLAGAAQTAPEPWAVAGRQGSILQVIVPQALASNREAYRAQIEAFCAGRETCFVNFYTNSTGAALTLPLPDAIANEATAVLRRSAKQGSEGFRWSCRLALPEPNCF